MREIEENPAKANSILNQSKMFHVTTNLVFDPMHDIFEGVASQINVIRYFDEKIFIHQHFFCNKRVHFNASIPKIHGSVCKQNVWVSN